MDEKIKTPPSNLFEVLGLFAQSEFVSTVMSANLQSNSQSNSQSNKPRENPDQRRANAQKQCEKIGEFLKKESQCQAPKNKGEMNKHPDYNFQKESQCQAPKNQDEMNKHPDFNYNRQKDYEKLFDHLKKESHGQDPQNKDQTNFHPDLEANIREHCAKEFTKNKAEMNEHLVSSAQEHCAEANESLKTEAPTPIYTETIIMEGLNNFLGRYKHSDTETLTHYANIFFELMKNKGQIVFIAEKLMIILGKLVPLFKIFFESGFFENKQDKKSPPVKSRSTEELNLKFNCILIGQVDNVLQYKCDYINNPNKSFLFTSDSIINTEILTKFIDNNGEDDVLTHIYDEDKCEVSKLIGKFSGLTMKKDYICRKRTKEGKEIIIIETRCGPDDDVLSAEPNIHTEYYLQK